MKFLGKYRFTRVQIIVYNCSSTHRAHKIPLVASLAFDDYYVIIDCSFRRLERISRLSVHENFFFSSQSFSE